jgi:hypothetical protein
MSDPCPFVVFVGCLTGANIFAIIYYFFLR